MTSPSTMSRAELESEVDRLRNLLGDVRASLNEASADNDIPVFARLFARELARTITQKLGGPDA